MMVKELHRHHIARIVAVIVAKRRVQSAAMCCVDVQQRIFPTNNWIYSREEFLVQIVTNVQRTNLNFLFKAIMHKAVSLRELLC